MPYKDPNGSKKEPNKKTPKKQSQHSTMSRVANASKLREGQQQDKKYGNAKKTAVVGGTVVAGIALVGGAYALSQHQTTHTQKQAATHDDSEDNGVHWVDEGTHSHKHHKLTSKEALNKNIDDIINAGKQADASSNAKVSKSIDAILNGTNNNANQNKGIAAVIGPASGKTEKDGVPAGVEAQLNNAKSVLAMSNVDTGNLSNGTPAKHNQSVGNVNPDLSDLYHAMANAPKAHAATDFLNPSYNNNNGNDNYAPAWHPASHEHVSPISNPSVSYDHSEPTSNPQPVTPATINPMPTNPFAPSANGSAGKLEPATSTAPAVISKPTGSKLVPGTVTSQGKPAGSTTIIKPAGTTGTTSAPASAAHHASASAQHSAGKSQSANNSAAQHSASVSASISASVSASMSASISASLSASMSASASASLAGHSQTASASIAHSMSASMSQSTSFSNGAHSASASHSASAAHSANTGKGSAGKTSAGKGSQSGAKTSAGKTSATGSQAKGSASANQPVAGKGSTSANKDSQPGSAAKDSTSAVKPVTNASQSANKPGSISPAKPTVKPATSQSARPVTSASASTGVHVGPTTTKPVATPNAGNTKPVTGTAGSTATSAAKPATTTTGTAKTTTTTTTTTMTTKQVVQPAASQVHAAVVSYVAQRIVTGQPPVNQNPQSAG